MTNWLENSRNEWRHKILNYCHSPQHLRQYIIYTSVCMYVRQLMNGLLSAKQGSEKYTDPMRKKSGGSE
jgi:hypothetical protein